MLWKLRGRLSPLQRQSWEQRMRRLLRPAWLGTLRRTTPLSTYWGYDRGTAVDRYYIESFLHRHREDIRGHVLEIKNSDYIEKFGSAVERSDILDIDPGNPLATIVADLTKADTIPDNTFDCFILTQTLQFIYDVRAAISHAHRVLRPGGVLLVTVPAVSQIDPGSGVESDYWRFTVASCSNLFSEVFGKEQIQVSSHGNVLTSIGFLAGMAHEELSSRELTTNDPYFPLIVTVRAVKSQ